jgi:hypothetical protein
MVNVNLFLCKRLQRYRLVPIGLSGLPSHDIMICQDSGAFSKKSKLKSSREAIDT